ncbi:MAG TPA: CRISPR-associated protein Cas5 [Parafilimonas sp.]|nr:CRISPR-associated protein Cas5 [Parafilimonas sp.]
MNRVLEIQFSGWTATPRMPFILSGNAVCMHTPSYSLLLGIIGCCLGRLVSPNEVHVGFEYSYDTVGKDIETRQRLEYDGKKIKRHSKGSDAYLREFHTFPKLIMWIDRIDWKDYFLSPIGTPSLGRSQDILRIDVVKEIEIFAIDEGELSGCMLPFNVNLQAGGQLVQLAESFVENEESGSGRAPQKSKVFLSIPYDSKVIIKHSNLFKTRDVNTKTFYLHQFNK